MNFKIKVLTSLLCATSLGLLLWESLSDFPHLQHTNPCVDDPWLAQCFNISVRPFLSANHDIPEDAFKWWKRLQSERRSYSAYRTTVDRLFKMFPPSPALTKSISSRYRNCAVVGNSINLKGSHYGALIDSHDVVMRMNSGPIKGYEEDVGIKTTHRMMYPESAMDLDNSTHFVLFPFKIQDLEWVIGALSTGFFKVSYAPIKSTIKANKDLVHVFGYGADKDGNWSHYWETLKNRKLRTGLHPGSQEFDIILHLAEKGKIKFQSLFPSVGKSSSSLKYHLDAKHPFANAADAGSSTDKTPTKSSRQTSLFECTRGKPVSTALSETLTNLLAQWIATSCRSISTVEDEGLELVLKAATDLFLIQEHAAKMLSRMKRTIFVITLLCITACMMFSTSTWNLFVIYQERRHCGCQKCLTEGDPLFEELINASPQPFLSRNYLIPEDDFKWWKRIQLERRSYSFYNTTVNSLFPMFPPIPSLIKSSPDRCRTCAVVGNSGNLKGSHYGALIDFHDIVIRMNHGPTKGYEEDVGTKTTHHVMYPQSSTNLDDTTHLVLFPFRIDHLLWLIKTFTPGENKAVERIANKDLVMILNPAFMKYVHEMWLKKKGNYPSTGFLTVALSMQMCDEVNIFGFGADRDGNWNHYFEPLKNKRLRTGQHAGTLEYQVIQQLHEKQTITFFKGR
ncbi:hypothetical protein PAMA_011282 [Pampus argenteus]